MQLVHDVLLQEVDADTKGVGRLALGKRQTDERSRISPLTLLLDRLTQDAHGPKPNEPRSLPP